MNLRISGQSFQNVEIPVLWGERAVLVDPTGRVSVVNLGAPSARLEILGDEPAPGVAFRPFTGGLVIMESGADLYSFDRQERTLTSITLGLPEVRLEANAIVVGTNRFVGNRVSGFGVGIAITPSGIALGAPLPEGLAKLSV